jgi:heme/copper-type cytochrome/quinol oxidase subunit 2
MFNFFPTLTRLGRAAAALASIALLSGCDFNAWWRMDGHQSTIAVDGAVAREQLEVFYVTCWVSLVIFIIVEVILVVELIVLVEVFVVEPILGIVAVEIVVFAPRG